MTGQSKPENNQTHQMVYLSGGKPSFDKSEKGPRSERPLVRASVTNSGAEKIEYQINKNGLRNITPIIDQLEATIELMLKGSETIYTDFQGIGDAIYTPPLKIAQLSGIFAYHCEHGSKDSNAKTNVGRTFMEPRQVAELGEILQHIKDGDIRMSALKMSHPKLHGALSPNHGPNEDKENKGFRNELMSKIKKRAKYTPEKWNEKRLQKCEEMFKLDGVSKLESKR